MHEEKEGKRKRPDDVEVLRIDLARCDHRILSHLGNNATISAHSTDGNVSNSGKQPTKHEMAPRCPALVRERRAIAAIEERRTAHNSSSAVDANVRTEGGMNDGSAHGFFLPDPPAAAAPEVRFCSAASGFLASLLAAGLAAADAAAAFLSGLTVLPSILYPVVDLKTDTGGGGASRLLSFLGGATKALPQLAARFTHPGYLSATPSRLATVFVNTLQLRWIKSYWLAGKASCSSLRVAWNSECETVTSPSSSDSLNFH